MYALGNGQNHAHKALELAERTSGPVWQRAFWQVCLFINNLLNVVNTVKKHFSSKKQGLGFRES